MDVTLISNQVEQRFGDACSRIYGEFADSTSRTLQQYFEDFTTKACSLLQNGFTNVVIASQAAFEQCCREAIEESVRSMRSEFAASLRRSMDAASDSLVSKFQEESLAEVKELETAKHLLQNDLCAPGECKTEEQELEQDPTMEIPAASLEAGPSASLFEEALKSFNAADFAAFTKQAELMVASDLISPPPSVTLPLPLPPPPPAPPRPSIIRRPHICSICGLKFALRSQLRRHLRSHVNAASAVVPPTVSPNAGPNPPSAPAAAAAAGDSIGAAPPNGAIEATAELLAASAASSAVSPERPFACDLCGRAFSKRWNLTAHLRIHTDERPFVCEACGKAFRRKSCLVIHRRSHSRERPFSCGVCGKSFADGSSRNKHQRLHMWLEQPVLLDSASGST